MNNILVVWDRMGDYHRIRTSTYQKEFQGDTLFTADLGASDNLYHWESSKEENHFVLSTKPAAQRDIKARFGTFKKLIKDNNINKVILSGYGKPEYIIFTIWLKLKGIDCYYFAESWYKGRPILDKLKGSFIKGFTKGIFASGDRAKQHFAENLSFPKTKILTGYSVVDNDHFAINTVEKTIDRFASKTLLSVARHSKEKNLELLIKAFKASKLSDAWTLKIVGGGPDTEKLRKLISSNDNIELNDWTSYDKLPSLYAEASFFILPSEFEPWGLVVNEAMASGLPIVLSNECGCVPELYYDNGYLFNSSSQSELENIFNLVEGLSIDEIQSFSAKSIERIKEYSPKQWSNHLHKLINN
jgi:glycosyltransferase involved in cell wall biosynthesis